MFSISRLASCVLYSIDNSIDNAILLIIADILHLTIISCILVPSSGAFEVWSPKTRRQYWQKFFIMLSGFWPFKGSKGLSESLEKIFFSDSVEWRSKNLWKMISADLKANKTTRNKRSGDCILQIILGVYFSFWFWLVFLSPYTGYFLHQWPLLGAAKSAHKRLKSNLFPT